MARPDRNRTRGITVMEILVILVIIGTVEVLVLSLLRKRSATNPKATRVWCGSNLRQIGIACNNYAADNGGRFPCGHPSILSNMSMLVAGPYLHSSLFSCPSDKKASAHFHVQRTNFLTWVSYSYQSGSTIGLTTKSFSNDVVMWDQGVAGNPAGPNGGIGLAWAPTSNHKGAGGNVLFLDGRVEWETKTPTNMTLGCLNP